MAAWTLDEKRFREEVFRALDNRWEPQSNWFRCVQLPVDVADPAIIAAAFKAVHHFVNRNLKTGTSSGAAKVLDKVLPDAEKTLTDATSRREHRALVLAHREKLAASLRAKLDGMPAIPPVAVKALADERQRFFTREEVEDALRGIGCPVREPVALPARTRAPANWKSVQHEVTFLGELTLRAYLQKHFKAVTTVTTQQLTARQAQLQSTASGDKLTAETSILTNVKKWVAGDQLVDLLRADLLRDLDAEASMGADRLVAVLATADTRRYLKELGLPDADDVAYALLCAQRYPVEPGSSWQAAYREARANRDLRSARDVLVANRPSLDKQFAAELTALDAELAKIDAARERARMLEQADVEAAAEEYVRILEVYRSPEVESALRRCRPAAPPRATATVTGETVTVTWTPSPARAGEITYRVVRHVGDGARVGDGVTLGEGLTALTVLDTAAPAGVALTYAVWTLRGDEPSSSPCRTATIAVLRAVRNLELLPGEQVVEAQWDLPDGATGARVTRHIDGRPAESPRRVSGGRLRDADVRVGVTYEYIVESEYRLADGVVQHGPATAARVRPQEPPQPVRDLTSAVEDETLVLAWTPPTRGEVEVRVLDAATPARPGQVVGATAASRLGLRARSVGAAGPGRLRMAVPADGRRHWLLPLTVVDGIAVVGVAVEYDSRLPAVTDLHAEQLGNQVQLRWRWPPRVSEVLILTRGGEPPTGPDDPHATRRRLTHAIYHRTGVTVAAAGADLWIGVCVTAFTDGAPVHGPMVTVSASVPRELSYEIQRVSGFRNRHLRRLVVELDGTTDLGAVCVVAQARLPPLSRDEGVELKSFGAPERGAPTAGGVFELRERDRPLFLRAFPTDGAPVVLVPAHPTQLRID